MNWLNFNTAKNQFNYIIELARAIGNRSFRVKFYFTGTKRWRLAQYSPCTIMCKGKLVLSLNLRNSFSGCHLYCRKTDWLQWIWLTGDSTYRLTLHLTPVRCCDHNSHFQKLYSFLVKEGWPVDQYDVGWSSSLDCPEQKMVFRLFSLEVPRRKLW